MKELNRPFTTLFLVFSVDGKISSGDTDDLYADRDWCRIAGVKEGLDQQTDLFSLNSGRVMAKVGVNHRAEAPKPLPVTFVIIDNQPH